MGTWIIVFGDEDQSFGSYQLGPFDSYQAAEDAAKELDAYAKAKDEADEFSYLAMAYEYDFGIYELDTVASVIANDELDDDPVVSTDIDPIRSYEEERAEEKRTEDWHKNVYVPGRIKYLKDELRELGVEIPEED